MKGLHEQVHCALCCIIINHHKCHKMILKHVIEVQKVLIAVVIFLITFSHRLHVFVLSDCLSLSGTKLWNICLWCRQMKSVLHLSLLLPHYWSSYFIWTEVHLWFFAPKVTLGFVVPATQTQYRSCFDSSCVYNMYLIKWINQLSLLQKKQGIWSFSNGISTSPPLCASSNTCDTNWFYFSPTLCSICHIVASMRKQSQIPLMCSHLCLILKTLTVKTASAREDVKQWFTHIFSQTAEKIYAKSTINNPKISITNVSDQKQKKSRLLLHLVARVELTFYTFR